MSQDYPVVGEIVVLKNGRRLGPFQVDEILDLLEQGRLDYSDVCLREGAAECERLGDVLDWEEEEDTTEGRTDTGEGIPARPDAVLYSGHRSIVTYPFPLFCLFGGIMAGIVTGGSDGWYDLLFYFVAIAALAHIAIDRFTSDYLISPKRIELIQGLIARSSKEARIRDIRSINVRCRGLTGMLGIGDVDFFTAGDEPEITFEKVWSAKTVKGLVRKLQDRTEEG